MSIDTEILPVSYVEELVRALTRALRAFQMYLPNNPMYQRGEQQLAEAFPPIWAVLDEINLLVNESDLIWEEQVVYSHPTKSESFAFGLYKDGMRLLTLRKGCEEEEAGRFLQTVSRARLLPADANDDLLTLLWQQDFKRIDYKFAEVVSDPWVYDPQALALQAAPETATVQAQVREEVAAARPAGMVDPEEFDSTLYFLDETEIAELSRQVSEEYSRDVRGAALSVLFDLLELEDAPEVRGEIMGVLEALFPNLLSRGEFRTVAAVLRELRVVGQRTASLDPAARGRIDGLEAGLSAPATIAQLLQALDEATVLPTEEDLGEVLRELRASALGEILTQLPRLSAPAVRTAIGAAAERLAAANTGVLFDLLGKLDAGALPGAIRLAGQLGVTGAIPPLGALVGHAAPEVRLAAVEVLGSFGTPGAMAALEPAIEDSDRAVRMMAVATIARRGYVGALRRLETIVLGKAGFQLERGERRQVFEAYAAVAGAPAVDTLKGLLLSQGGLFRRKASTDTRTCAVYALGRLRSAEARDLLEQLTSDKELPVRHAATSLLREWPG